MRLIIACIALILLLPGCAVEHEPLRQLERVQRDGVLRVISRDSPAAVYPTSNGPQGLEYELAERFAQELGVELDLTLVVHKADIIPMLRHGRADLAAAGLPVTEYRSSRVQYGPSYYETIQQLVYRRGNRRPSDLNTLEPGAELVVPAGSSQEELLRHIHPDHPDLTWTAYPRRTQQELLQMVADDDIGYTIANSNEIVHARRYYPAIGVAFDVTPALPVAWMFRRQEDTSLYDAVVDFFSEMEQSGELALLRERYFGHVQRYDYVDARSFLRMVAERLPDLQPHFEAAAAEYGFDWRLLAAMSYQESHWDPEARSPTGVRGLMMLTQDTAERVGIDDRTDPRQSIHGGARYLREVQDKIPERIPEPDRTWFALAAYNIGFGHLEDARRLTESHGNDPDLWRDVRQHLPLLSQEEWHKQTTYGYARGGEPVAFVQNIRRYYDVLLWIDRQVLPPANDLHPPVPLITPPVL
jgi:membrane-bound lytic murein transglycosylase F